MSPEKVVPTGYDEEDRYFHEQQQELLRKRRAELDAKRKDREQEADQVSHWMKCPKCGSQLEEIGMDGIMVDKCTGCEGVFFDQGEVELLLEAHKGGFTSGLRKLLGGR